MKHLIYFSSLFLLILGFTLNSCKKDVFTSKGSGNLEFSVDTLIFDTVFTTVGSTTQQFKIYNPDNKVLKIDEIELVGGTNSPFRINVDGLKGVKQTDIEIPAKDSLFVFVEVTLAVNGQSLPLIIEDSIRFKTNGKNQYVNLAVWGQDAYFHYKDLNEGTWLADKPHVVYDYAAVDSAKSLTIQAGAHIHFHKNSILFVYKGQLDVQGAKDNEVIFEGDRLETFYEDVAGQWYGIYLQEALPSKINYAIIKNGTAGIHTFSANPLNPSYTLEITNTKILNNASYGVFLYSGSKIKMENSLLAKNARNSFFVLEGGSFNINHCDILGFGDSKEQNIAFAVKNYFTQDGVTNVGQILEGKIYNSVIYGTQADEFALDTLNPGAQVTFNFDFKNCLIKKENPSTHSMFSNIFWNSNPNFTDVELDDYHFLSTSILNGNANAGLSLPFDLDGKARDSNPDIGCYEL
ncbi:MAG: right-handed parallel beta-helix repeat-containing protein [Bacteroidota bacterium]